MVIQTDKSFAYLRMPLHTVGKHLMEVVLDILKDKSSPALAMQLNRLEGYTGERAKTQLSLIFTRELKPKEVLSMAYQLRTHFIETLSEVIEKKVSLLSPKLNFNWDETSYTLRVYISIDIVPKKDIKPVLNEPSRLSLIESKLDSLQDSVNTILSLLTSKN